MIRPVALLLTLLQSASAPPAPDYPFAVGETLHSVRLPNVTISIAGIFEIAN